MTEIEGEVLAEEDVETARNLPAVVAHEAMVTRAEITPDEVKEQRDKIVQVMQKVMVDGQHYGNIPGIDKPTLLKPGAELLAVTMRLAPHYDSERIFHDDGHLTVVSKVTLVHIPSGLTIAEGEGLCTSREKKYGKRRAERGCPKCGATAIIKGKEEYGGGWLCWKKRDGCGAKFPDGDAAIESQASEDIDNPDLADTFNTVLKMANKRALIAAILNGTAASDIFTQDVEDAVTSPPATRAEEATDSMLPRTWVEVNTRGHGQLGDDWPVWVEQVNAWAGTVQKNGKMPPPTLLQRMAAVVADLEATGNDWAFTTRPRPLIQAIFAKHLDGEVLAGPEHRLNGDEPRSVEEAELDAAWEAAGK